ncbi:SHOCT domain-containing protein [Paenibacillus lupini]|uniref:SHOCT domain-containing protein n=1 Tax=Paenibacillus lupini TaxID=1450204 RepID=UPI0014240DFF|nr:SHOCT domain-containing protein [Paenibacillus lupini]
MYFWQKRKKKSINTSEVFAESISDELTDQIKKLADLRDTGLLTEEEFALKKKQLLGI